jgi:hypothetical protein
VSQAKLKAELDAQVSEKERKKVAEVEAKKVYKVEEETQLEQWKQEELDKIARKAEAIDKLKVDRQLQLVDKDRRRAAQVEVKLSDLVAQTRAILDRHR